MSRARPLQRKYSKIAAYKQVFNSPQGQVVLQDLILTHNILASTFDLNPHLQSFKEGERNAVLRIMTILKITATEMQALAKEIEEYVRSESSGTDAESSPSIKW